MRLVLLPLLLLLGCEGSVPLVRSSPIPATGFLDRPDAARLQVEVPLTVVFRSRTDWLRFWIDYHEGALQEAPAIPSVPEADFSTRMLVGVFMGRRSGCGGGVTSRIVNEVQREGNDLVVSFTESPDLGACRAIRFPYQVIEVERVPGEVVFVGAGRL
ncbi:MAG: hypothetical protein AAGI52_12410 [Bacteroidota bacterium]